MHKVVETLDVFCKPWNQRLGNCITKYELWAYNQDLDTRSAPITTGQYFDAL